MLVFGAKSLGNHNLYVRYQSYGEEDINHEMSAKLTCSFVGAALKCAPIMEWEFILASGRSSF